MISATQKERLYESFGAVYFTVYADFNCPFSYALSERLHLSGLEQQVDFRMIQREPQLRCGQIDLELLAELTSEVAEVRRRAPSTEINVPMFRPGSAAASALVYAVSRQDPSAATQLRRRIFRALWVEGMDISRPGMLASLLLELDIDLPSPDSSSNEELSAWQSEWANNTEFARHLPVVISECGETLIGFPLEPELESFLESGSLLSDEMTDGLWESRRRQRILVLDNDAVSLRMIIEQMHDAQVEVVEDFIGLIAHARSFGMPDMVIVNTSLVGSISGSDWWRNWTNSDACPAIPVIHITESRTPEAKAAAFALGAVDVISRPFHPRTLRARLYMHLQALKTQQRINGMARIDALTSVCNRREFDARLSSEWIVAADNSRSLALLIIDVDKFRDYNDRLGHLHGDDCLVKVAKLLNACIQPSGKLLARFDGAVFVVLMPDEDADSALELARETRRAIAASEIPHPASPVGPYVTVSVGISAMLPTHGLGCTLMIEQAEIALFQAKRQGPDRVCVFDEVG